MKNTIFCNLCLDEAIYTVERVYEKITPVPNQTSATGEVIMKREAYADVQLLFSNRVYTVPFDFIKVIY